MIPSLSRIPLLRLFWLQPRLAWWALSAAGLAVYLAAPLLYVNQGGIVGFDAYSYWRPPHFMGGLYGAAGGPSDGLGVYRYSPLFIQLVGPLGILPWPAFLVLWTGLLFLLLIYLGGIWTLALGLSLFVPIELLFGNIHFLLAAMVAFGLRWPALWSLGLLTKVTPGIGLLWFAMRGEWRQLAIGLGATAILVAVSMLLGGVTIWQEWLASLGRTVPSQADNVIPLGPLWLRLLAASVLIAWGARTDRSWVLPLAVTLSLPTIWLHGLTILVALIPLTLGEARWRLSAARTVAPEPTLRPPASCAGQLNANP